MTRSCKNLSLALSLIRSKHCWWQVVMIHHCWWWLTSWVNRHHDETLCLYLVRRLLAIRRQLGAMVHICVSLAIEQSVNASVELDSVQLLVLLFLRPFNWAFWGVLFKQCRRPDQVFICCHGIHWVLGWVYKSTILSWLLQLHRWHMLRRQLRMSLKLCSAVHFASFLVHE